MPRSASPRDLEIEEAVLAAELLADEIESNRELARVADVSGAAKRLRSAARVLRLALVARIACDDDDDRGPPTNREGPSLTLLHLRLESAMREADALFAAEPPQSQRPTVPPPPDFSPDSLMEQIPPSNRPTLVPPRKTSEVRPAAGSGLALKRPTRTG